MPIPTPVLPFEAWLVEHQEELRLKAYELGALLMYDFENFALKEYEAYCTRCSMAM